VQETAETQNILGNYLHSVSQKLQFYFI